MLINLNIIRISNIDKYHLYCNKNSKDWFGHQIPLDVIDEYYQSPIKLKRGGKNPTLRIRVPLLRGSDNVEVYHRRKRVDISKVHRGDTVRCIIELGGMRFLNQQFQCESGHPRQGPFHQMDQENVKKYFHWTAEQWGGKISYVGKSVLL